MLFDWQFVVVFVAAGAGAGAGAGVAADAAAAAAVDYDAYHIIAIIPLLLNQRCNRHYCHHHHPPSRHNNDASRHLPVSSTHTPQPVQSSPAFRTTGSYTAASRLMPSFPLFRRSLLRGLSI